MESAGKDWERSERNKERRHKELMEAQKKRKTATRRRVLRDEHGRFIAVYTPLFFSFTVILLAAMLTILFPIRTEFNNLS